MSFWLDSNDERKILVLLRRKSPMFLVDMTIRLISTAIILLLLTACTGPVYRQIDAYSQCSKTPAQNAITFLGHACSYIDINGTGIVTDPVFDDSYFIFRRRKIPPPPPSAYAGTDIILISHAHRDHLSPKTLATFPKTAVIISSEPSAKFLSDLGMTVNVMKPGQSYQFRGGTITAVAAYHPGGRNSVIASADGRALGFVIQTSEMTLYYSGDTEYFEGLRAIGKSYHPDIAIINLNSHLNSSDFLRTVFMLGASTVIPIHYGAYGSPSSKKVPGWCTELKESLGTIFTQIDVGRSYPILLPPGSPVTTDAEQCK